MGRGATTASSASVSDSRSKVRLLAAVRVALALVAFSSAHLVMAQTPRTLWQQGQFEEAYSAALQAGQTAESGASAQQGSTTQAARMYLLAARAAADVVVYDGAGLSSASARRWLELSLAASERAVALVPITEKALLSEAVMAKARAKGEVARRSGVLQNLNVAAELKQLFDQALSHNPTNPDALVGLGMWHLELVVNNVGWLYGGRRDQVLPLVESGVAAAPEQVNLRVEYATALIALGEPGRAREQLAIALSLPAGNAVDRAEQARARSMLSD